jgi:hypothetical protein
VKVLALIGCVLVFQVSWINKETQFVLNLSTKIDDVTPTSPPETYNSWSMGKYFFNIKYTHVKKLKYGSCTF